jgi:hypothetical protein
VTPVHAAPNCTNGAFNNTEHFSQFCTAQTTCHNHSDIVGAKSSRWAEVIFLVGVTPFSGAVSHIIKLSAEKKVIRIDARPHVTAVQYADPIRNRAAMQFPTYAMSVTLEVPIANFLSEVPISIRRCVVGPYPTAAIRFRLVAGMKSTLPATPSAPLSHYLSPGKVSSVVPLSTSTGGSIRSNAASTMRFISVRSSSVPRSVADK